MLSLKILYFCYFILTAIIFCDITYILYKYKYIGTYIFCKVIYLFAYALIPLIIHIKYSKYGTLYPMNIYLDYSESGIDALYISCLLSFIGYIFLTLGYLDNHKLKFGNNKTNVKKLENNDENILRSSVIITATIGVISLYVWSKAYGGVNKLILEANAVRGGFSEVYNPFAFFKRFASILLISSYGFFVLIVQTKKKKLIDILFWILTLVLSFMFLLASDGRMTAGFYFIGYLVIYVQCKSRLINQKLKFKDIIRIIIFLSITILIMMKMDDLTYYIRNGVRYSKISRDESSLINGLIYELSFVEKSSQVAILNARKIGLQLLDDIGYGLTTWIPSRWLSSSFARLWSVNTELANVASGELPCGIVTQGFYDLRISGVIIFTFLYGKLIKKVDSLNINTMYGLTLYASIFYPIVRVVSYGMFYDIILGLFKIFVFVVIYSTVRKLMRTN